MNYTTERLYFSEITPKDIPAIHTMNSFKQVAQFNTIGIPKALKDTENLLNPVFKDQQNTTRKLYSWTIRLKTTDTFIGELGMRLAAPRFSMAEIHYSLHPSFWGKGFATEAVTALLKWGFDTLQLHRIEAGVATENSRSIHLLEKVGMTREGLRRKILPIDGVWKDNYMYAKLDTD